MTGLGIMQGRLTPPRAGHPQSFPWNTWQEEFAVAHECGFTHLEWLVTAERVDENPIFTGAGDIRRCGEAANVRVTSLCADCFIKRPFVGASASDRQANIDLLTRLIQRSAPLGISVIVVPLLETAAIVEESEVLALIECWQTPIAVSAALGVRLAIESDWNGPRLRGLIDSFASPAVGACYDVGNAAAFGYDALADLRALADVLCAVHIKDRRRSGSSVGLGEGDADLPGFVAALATTSYAGPLILETPAGADPRLAAGRHREFMNGLLRATATPQ